MSPRQDTYLSLCLEQASKSPMHYRHGCIIVRGGKVIGRGFNHYRPGFNGGAMKNGSTKAVDDTVLQKIQQSHKSSAGDEVCCAYGGGSTANTALSMHSEMMAIRSALSLSSHQSGASARSAAWYETPCFKLPSRGKREHKLRTEKIRQHVERICEAAEKSAGEIKSDALATQNNLWRFEPATSGLIQAQQHCSQRASSEPERGSEGEGEQKTFSRFASARRRSIPVSVSVS